MPTIDETGETGVWVGELQRVLGAGLDLNVGRIDADPDRGGQSGWGTFTDGTADALRQFQARSGLKPTGSTNADTWRKLQGAVCR